MRCIYIMYFTLHEMLVYVLNTHPSSAQPNTHTHTVGRSQPRTRKDVESFGCWLRQQIHIIFIANVHKNGCFSLFSMQFEMARWWNTRNQRHSSHTHWISLGGCHEAPRRKFICISFWLQCVLFLLSLSLSFVVVIFRFICFYPNCICVCCCIDTVRGIFVSLKYQ